MAEKYSYSVLLGKIYDIRYKITSIISVSCILLSPPRRPKASCAALSLVQGVHLDELRCDDGHDEELGDALAWLHGLGNIAVVMEGDHQLAAVVRINDADLIGGGQSTLGGQAAAGEVQSHVALGDGHREAGMDEYRLAGGYGDGVPLGESVEVGPCRPCRAVGRQDGRRVEFFDFEFHIDFLS